MLGKNQLEDGAYYYGSCRNGEIARWSAAENVFFYRREKFGMFFIERINHFVDDSVYDTFVPVRKIEYDGEEIPLKD